MKYCIILLLSLITHLSISQEYIITIKGDTLRGEITIELPNDNYDEVFITTDDEKIRLKAYQLIKLVKDSVTYKPVKFADKYHLMKLISDGYLSHYQYRNGTYDFGVNFLLKADGDGFDVPNLGFKKSMSEFVDECEPLSNKILNKELGRNDLNEIVSEYNNYIQKNTLKSKLNVNAVMDSQHPAIKMLNELKEEIPQDNTELNTLINDMLSKLVAGNSVPGYLISALKDQTNDIPELKEKVEAIAQVIK